MTYFGRELIAWRAESGQLTVMDAYCEHLGAHLGYGGTRRGRGPAVPVPRLAVESRGPQRLHPVRGPAQPRPTHHDATPSSSATSRSTSGTTSSGGEPYFDAPDIFAEFRRRQQCGRLLPAAAPVPRGPGDAPAVRPRERRRLRAFQVRAPDADRPGVHPPRLRRTGVLRRLHDHLRRRRRARRSTTSTAASRRSTAGSASR